MATKAQLQERYDKAVKMYAELRESYEYHLTENDRLTKELSDAKSYCVDYEKKIHDLTNQIKLVKRTLETRNYKFKKAEQEMSYKDSRIKELENFIVNLALDGVIKGDCQ